MRYEKGSFIVIPNKECLDGVFSHLQVVYMWICSYADERGVCFPSRTTIARNSGCSVKTVDRAIEGLVECGFLKKLKRVENGKNLTNVYQIMLLENGGRDSQSLGSVRESLGVGTESRTELNPVLTKSTEDISADAQVVYEVEEEKPTKVSKAKYPHSKEVFALFGKYPLSWERDTTQLVSAEALYNERGVEEIKNALYWFKDVGHKEFCPQVSTPRKLDTKWEDFEKFVNEQET